MITLEGVPDAPITRQLADCIADGMSADDAAEKVVAPYRPAPAAEFMWPAVRNAALTIERQHHRQIEDAALGPAGVRAKRSATLALPRMTFKLGNGDRVVWDDATRDQHLMRVAWQRGQMAAIGLDIERHMGSVELIDKHGVACLREIPDWVQKLDELLAAKHNPAAGGDGCRGGDGVT